MKLIGMLDSPSAAAASARSFEQRTTASLQQRDGELRTIAGQLQPQHGGRGRLRLAHRAQNESHRLVNLRQQVQATQRAELAIAAAGVRCQPTTAPRWRRAANADGRQDFRVGLPATKMVRAKSSPAVASAGA